MKLMKTKLGLSVLALACLGAGAVSLQPTVKANADDVTYEYTTDATGGLKMKNGAAVQVDSNVYSGIRWETTVSRACFSEYGATAKYGVIVAPTGTFGDELTHEDSSFKDLNTGTISVADEAVSYYSAINFNNIWVDYQASGGQLTQEAVLKSAYAMELTARAYVLVGNTYYYADMTGINTSRSARQVAIAAELAGEINEKYRNNEDDEYGEEKAATAVAYYGGTQYIPTVKSTGAVGTTVINLETLATKNVNVKFTSEEINVDDIDEVLVGAERMRDTIAYASGKFAFRVLAGQNLPTGEQYATVFMKDGTIKTYPVICATKVLTQASELAMFNAKGNNSTKSTKVKETTDDDGDGKKETTHNYYEEGHWSAEQEQSGYYVLGANIDASTYKHGSGNDATWNSAEEYYNMPIGLTGTFNGMGFAIKDMEIGTQREGFFGIVNGGTVKNTAFLDVKATGDFKYVIANYLLNATIENVYVTTDKYIAEKDATEANPASMGFPAVSGAILAEYTMTKGKGEQNVVKNCSFVFNTPNSMSTDESHGFLFRAHKADNLKVEYTNVHVASGNNFNYNYMDGETKIKENVRQRLMYDSENKRVYLAENEAVNTGTDENPNWQPSNSTSGIYPVADFVARLGLNYEVLTGVYRYKSLAGLKNVPAAIEWMPAAWLK